MQRAIALITHHSARSRRLAALWGRLHVATLTATRGRVGASWFGAPILVLVTVGRKSGRTRRTPVIYVREGDAYVLVAANGGNDRAPAWWLNLRARDTVEVLVGGRRHTLRWREVPAGPEYDRLLAKMLATYPPGEHYRGFTDRHLPVVVLGPAG